MTTGSVLGPRSADSQGSKAVRAWFLKQPVWFTPSSGHLARSVFPLNGLFTLRVTTGITVADVLPIKGNVPLPPADVVCVSARSRFDGLPAADSSAPATPGTL